MKRYVLDPAWYFTPHGLAWDAAVTMTKVELELLGDADMLLMIESAIRGGITTISHCYEKANNECIGTEFDLEKESNVISHLYVNGLYALTMLKRLSTGT